MRPMTFRAFALSGALLALLLSGGCATNGDASAMKAALNAQASADEANRTAAQAVTTANEAKNEAAAARAAAEAARRAAEEARAVALQVNEKIDRAFKKSVQK